MKDRLAKLQKAIPEGVGGVLITSPVNRRYYTGFQSSAGTVLVTRRKSYFLVDARYFEAAQATVGGCAVVLQDKLPEQLLGLCKQHRVKAVGVESRAMTVEAYRTLQKDLAGVEIVADDRFSDRMAEQRAVKSGEELEQMRAAQKIADLAFTHILGHVEAGRTEREVAVELELFCRRNGSDGPSFSTIVASGPNSAKPHAEPGDRRIETGDFVTMDYGCTVNGYCSDMTRTVAVGAVSPHQRECYETVLAAQLAALEAVRGGAVCAAVDKVARDIIDASEFAGKFGHGLGHCIGLEVHELPRCNHISTAALEPGMVTSVEPGIYLPGRFGVRIEDCVVVTAGGCENLCTSPKELIIL